MSNVRVFGHRPDVTACSVLLSAEAMQNPDIAKSTIHGVGPGSIHCSKPWVIFNFDSWIQLKPSESVVVPISLAMQDINVP